MKRTVGCGTPECALCATGTMASPCLDPGCEICRGLRAAEARQTAVEVELGVVSCACNGVVVCTAHRRDGPPPALAPAVCAEHGGRLGCVECDRGQLLRQILLELYDLWRDDGMGGAMEITRKRLRERFGDTFASWPPWEQRLRRPGLKSDNLPDKETA